MNEYPCILCQNGDPYSNTVCDDCEAHQFWLKELNEKMESLVYINNELLGHIPMDISDNVRDEVKKIWDQLYYLKIPGKERCY